MNIILLFCIGAASGVISGMGIGGGAILIPALTIFIGMEQHAAQNINLIYFIPTAIIALFTHVKNKQIEKKILPKIIITGLIGAVIGAMIAVRIDSGILRKMFGFFLLIMGVMEFLKKEKQDKNGQENDKGIGDKKMDLMEFIKMKEEFQKSDTDHKVSMYVSAEGLTQTQYKELLKLFPLKELYKLEEALQ